MYLKKVKYNVALSGCTTLSGLAILSFDEYKIQLLFITFIIIFESGGLFVYNLNILCVAYF